VVDRTVHPTPNAYPEDLSAGLLKVAGVGVLAAVMATLDTTVVSVAQRTFITGFHTTQAVVRGP
jgi:MFS transporter, DHA2 family, multidrug resistance protein